MFTFRLFALSGSMLVGAGMTLVANHALANHSGADYPTSKRDELTQQADAALTIIGRVSHPSGYGIAGVTIDVFGGIATTTDSSGFFTVSVPPGEYDLTPSAPGLTFQPPLRRVRGTGTQAGQNFISLARASQPIRPPTGPRTMPAFPSAMRGVATVGGFPAPDGSIITVVIDGLRCATHPERVTTEGGLYFLAILYGATDNTCAPGSITLALDGQTAAMNITLQPGIAMELNLLR